jgi:hypothetical protein
MSARRRCGDLAAQPAAAAPVRVRYRRIEVDGVASLEHVLLGVHVHTECAAPKITAKLRARGASARATDHWAILDATEPRSAETVSE